MTERPEIITASVETFAEMSGISRRTIYRLIKNGVLRSVLVGTRRLIVVESYREYLTHLSTHPPARPSMARHGKPGRASPNISLVRDG
jgi:excisionase family DNA binding protein